MTTSTRRSRGPRTDAGDKSEPPVRAGWRRQKGLGTQEAYSAGYEVGFRDGIGSAEKSLVRGLVRDIAKADGARAAVDLIRKRLATEGHDPGCDGSHQWCDPDALPPGPRVWDIIDEVLTELAGEEYKAA